MLRASIGLAEMARMSDSDILVFNDIDQAMFRLVGLAGMENRYPHEFSGGQRQRIALARALITNPDLVVCDEPVSALDASVQAQVLNAMRDLHDRFGQSLLFITHNLAVVGFMCSRILVMYLGEIVEELGRDELDSARHPYTQALFQAMPDPTRLHEMAVPEKSPPRLLLRRGVIFIPAAPERRRCAAWKSRAGTLSARDTVSNAILRISNLNKRKRPVQLPVPVSFICRGKPR